MSLSEENIKKLIFGGVYITNYEDIEKYCSRYNDGLNNQHYRLWVPTHYKEDNKEEYYMIDTYQVSRNLFSGIYDNNKEVVYKSLIQGVERLKTPEDAGNWGRNMPFDYYYSAIVKLTDENFKIFKLYVDLHKYRLSDGREAQDYAKKDVVYGIKLYYEHAYSQGGITLVKKNAKINFENKINALASDIIKNIDTPYVQSDYQIEEILKLEKEALQNGAKYNKKRLDATIKYKKFMNNLTELYRKFSEEINDDLINKEENK